MSRVVILGSKPNARIPLGERLYCSNGSIGLYALEAKRFSYVGLVTINPVLEYYVKNRNEGNPYRDFNEYVWHTILTVPSHIVTITNRNIDKVSKSLLDGGFSGSLTKMMKYERRKMIERISGCRDPIVTEEFWDLPSELRKECLRSIVKNGFRRFYDKTAESHCVLRPSTGIMTLVYAISEHGYDAHYIVSGIGVNKRGEYAQGKNENKKGQNIYSHILADKKVLAELNKRYSISTTEPELMGILPEFTDWDV